MAEAHLIRRVRAALDGPAEEPAHAASYQFASGRLEKHTTGETDRQERQFPPGR
jgi:hypothetical protein